MPAARVVPGLDPLEDGQGELLAGVPADLVQHSTSVPKKLSTTELSKQSPTAHGAQQLGGPEAAAEGPAGVLGGLKGWSQR